MEQSVVPPVAQVPEPSQASAAVSTVPLQDALAPQAVPDTGKLHAPLVSQSVAPQAPPTMLHAALQQLPTPVVPQTPLVHWSFAEHAPTLLFATHAPFEQ
jgi:hypothetical protein